MDSAVADTSVTEDVPDPDASVPVMVTTQRGPIVGRDFGTSMAFLGIPYAASPTGALRWRPPVERDAWTTPLDATHYSLPCPLPPGGLGGQLPPATEDCLTVNVWTPSVAAAASRAVMVFIHGGGFGGGTGTDPLYNGRTLAERGNVVVVTIEYRLAQLGFLAHPSLVAEDSAHHSAGNYGFLDQQAALRWVRANAASFGGNPANVTIFGESAGSISVCAHMASPLSAGLFERAIGQSGPCAFLTTPLHDTVPASTRESAEALGGLFATALGCDTATDVLACMRSKPYAEIVAASPRGLELRPGTARYEPNIDGYVFTERPWISFQNGRVTHVPFLSGTNRDEGTFLTVLAPVHNQTEYEAAVRNLLPTHVPDVMRLYPASDPAFATVNDAYTAFLTDAVFICPARAQARYMAALGMGAYLYHFTRLNPGPFRFLGVFHGQELPYVFGNFTSMFTRTSADTTLSNSVIGYWTRFANTGDPNGAGATMWPVFTMAGDAHLEFGDTTQAGTGLHRTKCDEAETWLDGL